MQAREQEDQGKLFRSRLELICNHNDPLYRLANAIEWSEFDSAFGDLYSDGMGRPAKPTRLMAVGAKPLLAVLLQKRAFRA